MNFVGEIIELYLQWGNFLENLISALHKETKRKVSVFKVDVSCYFHSFPRDVFRTLLTSKIETFYKKG